MNLLYAWPRAKSLIDAITARHLSSLQQRQMVASELAEMVRLQLEALPGDRQIVIKNLTLNVRVNYCSGGGASMTIGA